MIAGGITGEDGAALLIDDIDAVAAGDQHGGIAGDINAPLGVARNDVAGAGRRAADRVEQRVVKGDAVAAVAQGERAGGIGAEIIALNDIVAGRVDFDAVAAEAIDREASDHALPPGDASVH